jgi:hypothetical protein
MKLKGAIMKKLEYIMAGWISARANDEEQGQGY